MSSALFYNGLLTFMLHYVCNVLCQERWVLINRDASQHLFILLHSLSSYFKKEVRHVNSTPLSLTEISLAASFVSHEEYLYTLKREKETRTVVLVCVQEKSGL